jgi:hypothetical protein
MTELSFPVATVFCVHLDQNFSNERYGPVSV